MIVESYVEVIDLRQKIYARKDIPDRDVYELSRKEIEEIGEALLVGDESVVQIADRYFVPESTIEGLAMDAVSLARSKLHQGALAIKEVTFLEVNVESHQLAKVRKMMLMGFSVNKIVCRTGLTFAQVQEIIRETEIEIGQHTPDQHGSTPKNHIARMIDTVTDESLKYARGDTDTAIANRKLVLTAAQILARLHGVNAPTQYESKSLNVTISADATRKVLADPEMRRLQMEMEAREIELNDPQVAIEIAELEAMDDDD